MKQALVACAAGVLLVAPGATAKPDKTDRTNAAKQCRAERGSTDATREAFRVKYATNKSGKNAFGKCVSATSKEEKTESEAVVQNASKECKAERDLDAVAFSEKYGTNKNAKNAFGKCVSAKAKENETEEDAEDAEEAAERKSAAKECAAERTEAGEDAFEAKYATNANKRNAFGKCVSRKASA